MLSLELARKYAKAIFEIAKDDGKLKEYGGEISAATKTIFDVDALRSFLLDPEITAEAKCAVAKKVFAGNSVSPMVMNFLLLLIEKRRVVLLQEIDAEYQGLANEALGIRIADVTTATPLLNAQATTLRKKLEALSKKTIRLRPHVDPSIIGGVIVQIGDRRIDGSVTGRLAALQSEILASQ